jgi:DUF1680 family protein
MKVFDDKNTTEDMVNFTDKFFCNPKTEFAFEEITHKTAIFTEKNQLLDSKLWQTFVRQFEIKPDDANLGWRCEYWGKMMRGACMVYAYTKNPDLLRTLTEAVRGIMKHQDERGRISTYSVAKEFNGWDMWGRKYVLLGMQHFLEINEDEALAEEVIRSMRRQVDYLIGKIGNEEGKIRITRTARHWYGLNSSSILEPVVRLYNITGDPRYLDFAQYIADEGATYVENIFRLAEKKELRLYQYPVTKAYEMISCFEGLTELYRVTKTDWYKTAILNFADLLLEDELSVIGCSGCTHELFDHTAVRQANTNNYYIMQETCVTVTLMKFFLRLNMLTGNSKYIDAFENSYYNAYLGSVNTEGALQSEAFKTSECAAATPRVLPFDSYSPLTAGKRGRGIGGFQVMEGGEFYGCCVCIAAAGIGSVPRAALLESEKGIVINMYLKGKIRAFTPSGAPLEIVTDTLYPADGRVKITVNPEKEEEFTLALRIPAYSIETELAVCGEKMDVASGYTEISRVWKKGDSIELVLDMRTEYITPTPYGTQVLMNKVVWGESSVTVSRFDREDPLAKNHFALRRGPLMLARDSRLEENIENPISVKTKAGFVDVIPTTADFDTQLAVEVELQNGNKVKLVDYASAGKLMGENKLAVWMKRV